MRRSTIIACAFLLSRFGRGATAPDWVTRAAATPVAASVLAGSPPPDSVVLWRQRIVTAGSITGSTKLFEREAVKALTHAGASSTVFQARYDDDSALSIEGAWTLHADSSSEALRLSEVVTIQLADPEYFTDTRRVAFRPPRLAPGEVAAYALSRKSRKDVYQWILPLQGNDPVVAQEIAVDLPEGWRHQWKIVTRPEGYSGPLNGKGGNKASYPFPAQRGIREELWSPPEADQGATFELAILPPADKFARFVFRDWKDLGSWYEEKCRGVNLALPDDLLRGLGGDLRVQASRWVQEKVRYIALEVGQGGYVPRAPSLVAQRLFGDCKDKAFLLRALLARKGIEAYPVLTRSRLLGTIDPEFPTPSAFNHMILAVRIPKVTRDPASIVLAEGPAVLFDPTDEWTPFGELPRTLQGSRGLVIGPGQPQLVDVPFAPAERNRLIRSVSGSVTASGLFTASVEEKSEGAESERSFYQERTSLQREEALARAVGAALPGARPSDLTIARLGERDVPLEARYQVSSAGYLRKIGNIILLPALLFAAGPRRGGVTEGRRLPVYLGAPRTIINSQTLWIPSGLRIDTLPDEVDVDTAYVSYRFQVKAEGDRFRSIETFVVKKPEIPLSDLKAWKAIEDGAAKGRSAAAVLVAKGE